MAVRVIRSGGSSPLNPARFAPSMTALIATVAIAPAAAPIDKVATSFMVGVEQAPYRENLEATTGIEHVYAVLQFLPVLSLSVRSPSKSSANVRDCPSLCAG